MRQRLEIVHDRRDAGLRRIGAIGVRSAAGRSRTEGTAAVTIFRIPVVGARGRIRIFDFIHHAGIGRARCDHDVVRRSGGVAVAIAEPDGVAVAQHDVIRAGAAIHGLVEVVAHRVIVGEALEVRGVAVLDVVEAHRRGSFAGGQWQLERIFGAEVRRLRDAVCARADRDFHPGEQSRRRSRKGSRDGLADAAIELLPHLVEAMHRAGGIRVVGKGAAVGQLKRTRRQRVHVRDSRVGRLGISGRCRRRPSTDNNSRASRFPIAVPGSGCRPVT